ncbi:MAG: helix-turn-helix transcriptional regulator [Spirochaetales bacterium]|nr:helix-turn-helix transcriptional regulator [Spirochaetales bacterium]
MINLEYIGTHYKEDKNLIIDRPSGSQNFLFLLFHTDVYLVTNGKTNILSPGTAILFSPNTPQFYHHPVNGFDNDWFHFSKANFENDLNLLKFPINKPLKIKNPIQIHNRILEIEKEYLMKDIEYKAVISNLINNFFIELSREHNRNNDHKQNPYYHDLELSFRDIRTTMLSSISKKWSLPQLANLSGLSSSRFSFLYKYFFGTSPKEDLLNERFNIAKHYLASSSQPISAIAATVGYDDIYQFSKQFKKHTGISPSKYREG